MSSTAQVPTDDRKRYTHQAYDVTTAGVPLEASAADVPYGKVVEASYSANFQIRIDCEATAEGIPQLFTLPKGVLIFTGQTIEGAAGVPVALITAEDPGVNTKTLFAAKALGATENVPIAADTPLDLGDTSNNNKLSITVTGAAGGYATLNMNAIIAVTAWK